MKTRTLRRTGCILVLPLAVLVASCLERQDAAPHPDPAPASRESPAPGAPSPVRAELISDISIVQPGTLFRLGVMLTMDPGWSVHWMNPGASGEATRVSLQLPDRFEAQPLQWPVPVRFERPDGTEGFGYRDQVLIFSEVRSSNLDPDHEWRFGAQASWMACAKTCESGHAELELWLPPSISGTRLRNLVHAPVFEAWARSMPTPPDAPGRPFTVRVTQEAAHGGASPGTVLMLEWSQDASSVEWFPSTPSDAAFEEPVVRHDGRVTRLSFHARPGDLADPGAIDGVVAYLTPRGEHRGATLSVARR